MYFFLPISSNLLESEDSFCALRPVCLKLRFFFSTSSSVLECNFFFFVSTSFCFNLRYYCSSFSILLEAKFFWFPLRPFSLRIFFSFPLHPDSPSISYPFVSFLFLFNGCRWTIRPDMRNPNPPANHCRPSNCPSVNSMLQFYSPLRLSSMLIKQKDYFWFQ